MTSATLTTAALPFGPGSITASYGGDTLDLGSTSTALGVTVREEETIAAIGQSNSTPVLYQPTTLYAVVAPQRPAGGCRRGR